MEILNDRPNLLFLIWIRSVFINKNHLLITRLREPIYYIKYTKALTTKTTDPYGNRKWYLHGKLHRDHGPAIIFAFGDQEWWLNGKHHREDGPAIIYDSGDQVWYINGGRVKSPKN